MNSNLPDSVRMALDFDGWLSSQDRETRERIEYDLARANDRPAMVKRMQVTFFLAEKSGYPLAFTHDNLADVKAGHVAREGWSNTPMDDATFHGRMVSEAASEFNEGLMLFGEDGDNERAQSSRDASMHAAAYDAGTQWVEDGENAGVAFAKWQAAAKSSPNYRPENAAGYYFQFMERYGEGVEDMRKAKAAAEGAFPILSGMETKGRRASEAVPLFRDLTPRQRQLAIRGIQELAGRNASDVDARDTAGKAVIAAGRGLFNVSESVNRGFTRDRLTSIRFEEGQAIPDGTDDEVISSFLTTGNPGKPLIGSGNLTAERAAALNAKVQQRIADLAIEGELLSIGQNVVNPLRRDTWVQKMAVGGAESLGAMAVVASPVGIAAMTNAYRNDAEEKLMAQGIPLEKAQGLAMVIGPAQAALDRLQLGLLKKMPGLNGLLQRWSTKGAVNFAGRFAGTVAAETGIELAQDQLVPAVVQDVASWWDSEIPGVKWGDVKDEAWNQTPDVFFAVLPLALIGSGAATYRDFKNFRELARDPERLTLAGYSPAQINAIQAAETDKEAAALVREGWATRKPTVRENRTVEQGVGADTSNAGDQIGSVPAQLIDNSTLMAGDQQALTPGATEAEANQEAGIRALRRDDDGWHVELEDGNSVAVGTLEAARHMRETLLRARTEREANAMVAIADEIAAGFAAEGKRSSQSFTGDKVETRDGQTTRTTPKGKTEAVTFSTSSAAELDRELKLAGAPAGLIQGSNWIAEDGTEMMSTNQTVDGAMTQIHEMAERRMRAILAEDNGVSAVAAARVLVRSGLFDPAKQRDKESAAFAQRVQNIALPRTSETEIRETLVELAVANWMGRRKDGSNFAAGSVSTAIEESMRSVTSKAEMKALGKFRAFLRAVRAYLRGLFGLAAKLQKARRDGKLQDGDDFSALADRLMGLEPQRRHNEAVTKEVAKDEAFSLKPGMSKAPGAAQQDSTPPGGLSEAEAQGWASSVMPAPGEAAANATEEEYKAIMQAKARKIVKRPPKTESETRRAKILAEWEDRIADRERQLAALKIKQVDDSFPDEFPNPDDPHGDWIQGTRLTREYQTMTSVVGIVDERRRFTSEDGGKTWKDSDSTDFEPESLTEEEMNEMAVSDLREEKADIEFPGGYLDRIKLRDDMFGTLALPGDNWTLLDARSTIYGSIYFHLHDGTDRYKLSIRNHESSPVRAAEFGANDAEFFLADPRDLYELAAAMSRMEVWLQRKSQSTSAVAESSMPGSGSAKTGVRDTGTTAPTVNEQSPAPADGAESFSLASAGYLEALANRLENTALPPKKRLQMYQAQADTIRGMSRAMQSNDATAAATSAAAVNRERIKRRKEREAELLEEVAKDFGDLEGMEFMASAMNQPVIAAIMRQKPGDPFPRSDIRSRSNAEAAGRDVGGSYDGSQELPRWIFGGRESPDNVAQELFNSGILSEPSTDALWSEIEKALKSTGAAKERLSEYAQRRAEARAQAKEEARAWAEQQIEALPAEQRKAERKEMLRSLAVLDAILMKLPAEIRGKVGGFVKLASLQTDAARAKFIGKRITKMQTVLEKFLRDEYTDKMQALIERAEKKASEAGKKPGSSIGADAHSLISAMGRAMKMNGAEVDAELARLDSLIAGGTLTPEQEALAARERELVNLAGNWYSVEGRKEYTRKAYTDKAGRHHPAVHVPAVQEVVGLTAAEMAAAYEAAENTYDEGWLKWAGEILARRERREAARVALKADTGKAGTDSEKQARAEKDMGWIGKMKDTFLSLSSFGEAMRYVFGKDSKHGKDFTDREREASNAKEDAIQDISDRVADYFTQAAGSPYKGTQLQWKLSQPSIDAGPAGKLSEMQAIQALQMWAQPDGRRHMEAFGYDQAWADTLDKALSSDGRKFYAFLRTLYDAEYQPLNALYRKRHGVNLPKHNNYAPLTVAPMLPKAGEIVDPVTGVAGSGSLLTPGSLRTRSRVAQAQPEFRDALATYLAHVRQLEHWKAYYDLALDMQQVITHRDVSNSVKAAGGEQADRVLSGWANYFAQGGNRDAGAFLALNQGISKAAGRAAEMILFGRVGTLLIQSTQLGASLAEMPVGAYVKRMGMLFAGRLAWKDAIKSDYIQRRYRSYPPVVRQALDVLAASEPNKIKHAARELGKLIAGADALFTAGTYAVLLDYHRARGREAGLSGAALESYAKREAEAATDRVAQPTRPGARSLFENTSTGALARVGWAFASEARQKIALAAWAARTAKENPAQFVRTVAVVWGAGGLMAAMIRAAWRDMKDDDDDEVFDSRNWSIARIASQTLAGPFQGVPAVGEVLDAFVSRATGVYNPGGDILSQASDAVGGVQKIASGKTLESNEPIEDTLKAAKSILFTLGLANDTLAGANSLANLVEDAAKVVDNLEGVEPEEKKKKTSR